MTITRLTRTAWLLARVSWFIPCSSAMAQAADWRVEPYLPRPTSSQLNAVATVPGLALAVGEGGVAVVSTDSGSTWSLSTTGTKSSLRGVAFIDRATAVAVGLAGTIVRTGDGGRTWAPVPSPVATALRGLAFLPSGVGIAVGDGGVVLRTEDRGLSWTRVDVRQTATLRGVAFASPATVLALGDDGIVLRSRDGGLTWERRRSGTPAALRGVVFLDALTGVAVGGDDRRWRAAQVVIRTTDGGLTWQSMRPPSSYRLYGVSVIGPRSVAAVGDTGAVLRSGDGGVTWSASMVGHAWLSAVAAVDGGRAIAVGSYGAVWRTPDAGTTWVSMNDSPVADIQSMASPAPNVLVAAAGNEIVRADGAGRFSASRMAPPSKAPITHLAFANSRVGLATTLDGRIYRTTDGGASWRVMVAAAPKPAWAVAFADDHRAFVVGQYNDSTGVIRSLDAGISWSSSPSGMALVYDVATFGTQRMMAVGSGGSILRTADGGRNWRYARHGLTNALLHGVAIADSAAAIVVGTDGTVLRSGDDGCTWSRVAVATSLHLMAVAFADATHGAAVGFGGALLVTDDAGRSWQVVPTSVVTTLYTLSWVAPNELLVAGEGGLMLRATRPGAVARRPPVAPPTFANLTSQRARHD